MIHTVAFNPAIDYFLRPDCLGSGGGRRRKGACSGSLRGKKT